jgi:hypothetical protein
MANDKYVLKGCQVVRDPAGGADDFSGYCTSVKLNIAKKDVEASSFDDLADRHKKGTSGHTATFTFRPSSTFSGQLQQLIDDFNSDDPQKWEVRLKDAVPGVDNLRYRFDAVVTELPIGGNRGDLFEIQVTWPIDGHVEVYDGTNTTNL